MNKEFPWWVKVVGSATLAFLFIVWIGSFVYAFKLGIGAIDGTTPWWIFVAYMFALVWGHITIATWDTKNE